MLGATSRVGGARFAYGLVPSNLDETESHITAHTILLV
jgi:hypothetical protein